MPLRLCEVCSLDGQGDLRVAEVTGHINEYKLIFIRKKNNTIDRLSEVISHDEQSVAGNRSYRTLTTIFHFYWEKNNIIGLCRCDSAKYAANTDKELRVAEASGHIYNYNLFLLIKNKISLV